MKNQSMTGIYDNDHLKTHREVISGRNSNTHTSYNKSNENKQHTIKSSKESIS